MASANVLIAHEETFQQTVIERSREVPVLVDFWAPWCGPCRVLSPVLEQLAAEGGGTWLLVKVNTDENQGLARKYQVQGIPYCVLFKDGAVADSFVGAQSKRMVQAFLQKWLPSRANEDLTAIELQIRLGAFEEARASLNMLLTQTPDDEDVRLTFARLELAAGNPAEALAQLEHLPAAGSHARDVQALGAQARFAQNLPVVLPPLNEILAQVEANPNDLETRFQLGSAAALADARDVAAEQFLGILERNRDWHDGAARNALLDLFALWGDEAQETALYRQRMGWLLFA